ncbi:MAG: WcaF family extracellular polysaccharide biosynthesis acetyltransferase [Desulfobacteraceae bacterium]|nr:WcaF family extracellular polysaccharide biosynthesis acetyltransferase [Desulfobacteraceae bacterium]
MNNSTQDIWLKKSHSQYSLAEKLKMALWWFVEALLFRPSLHKMHAWRRFLLKIFGAKLGNGSSVHATAKIWFPWNLEMGNNSGIGFDALIYNLDKIKIGDFVTVSQRTHINTGSHDYTVPEFTLVTAPVHIESGAFIGTDSYINMGVTIGKMAVIGARSVVTKDMPENMICVGHPCKPIKQRIKKV